MLLNTKESTGQPPTTELSIPSVSAAKVKKPYYKQQIQHLAIHAYDWWESVPTVYTV